MVSDVSEVSALFGVLTGRSGQILQSKGLRSGGSVQPRPGSRKGQGASSAASVVL